MLKPAFMTNDPESNVKTVPYTSPDGTEVGANELGETIEAARKEAYLQLAHHPGRDQDGFCHILWDTQKHILKSKYHIDWKTPAELNPGIMYD